MAKEEKWVTDVFGVGFSKSKEKKVEEETNMARVRHVMRKRDKVQKVKHSKEELKKLAEDIVAEYKESTKDLPKAKALREGGPGSGEHHNKPGRWGGKGGGGDKQGYKQPAREPDLMKDLPATASDKGKVHADAKDPGKLKQFRNDRDLATNVIKYSGSVDGWPGPDASQAGKIGRDMMKAWKTGGESAVDKYMTKIMAANWREDLQATYDERE